MARLDSVYRTFAAAATSTASDGAAAAKKGLRDSIALYFQSSNPGTAASPQQAATELSTIRQDDSEQGPEGVPPNANSQSACQSACRSAVGQSAEALSTEGLPLGSIHGASSLMLRRDIRELLAFARQQGHGGDAMTGRVLSRVLHGLGSPTFPREEWFTSGVWGRYTTIPFLPLMAVCQQEFDDARLAQRRREMREEAAASAVKADAA